MTAINLLCYCDQNKSVQLSAPISISQNPLQYYTNPLRFGLRRSRERKEKYVEEISELPVTDFSLDFTLLLKTEETLP